MNSTLWSVVPLAMFKEQQSVADSSGLTPILHVAITSCCCVMISTHCVMMMMVMVTVMVMMMVMVMVSTVVGMIKFES